MIPLVLLALGGLASGAILGKLEKEGKRAIKAKEAEKKRKENDKLLDELKYKFYNMKDDIPEMDLSDCFKEPERVDAIVVSDNEFMIDYLDDMSSIVRKGNSLWLGENEFSKENVVRMVKELVSLNQEADWLVFLLAQNVALDLYNLGVNTNQKGLAAIQIVLAKNGYTGFIGDVSKT